MAREKRRRVRDLAAVHPLLSEPIERASRRVRSATAPALTWIRAALANETQLLFTLTIITGVLCGLAAVLFHLAIDGAQRLLIERATSKSARLWWLWVLLLPAAGGLVAGALLRWVVPGARGSGIPHVKKAFALDAGRVPFRDVVGKFALTTIQVGSGASLGREGPTVQICAGIASLLARAARLPPKNMRRLTPVGVAAGIAAAFNAPIAAVTFTIEEIVGGLDHSVLSGVVVAAALAAVIERGILGVHPMIRVEQSYGLDDPSSLIVYAALGAAAAIVSVLFTDGLLALRAGARRQTLVPQWMQPAVGGLVTGALAVLALASMDVTGVAAGGYLTLHKALAGQLALRALVALCALKMAATIASYSSGGAGGVFAPSLFIGAMLGGAVGHIDTALFEHSSRALGSFALVGMGAVFAGVIRAPITSVLIIFEMTGAYGLVLPLMLANATAYVLARRWRPVPLYEALLEQDGVLLPRADRAATHALEAIRVRDAMTRELVTARPDERASDVITRVQNGNFAEIPIINDAREIVGCVRREALADVPPDTPMRALLTQPTTIHADAALIDAIVLMNDRSTRHVFVRDRDGDKLLGALTISDVLRAHAQASPRATDSARPSLAPQATDARTAGSIAVPVPLVTHSTQIDAVLAAIETSPHEACVVIDARDAPIGVIRWQHLRELVRDRELQRMLVADDLLHRAPVIEESTLVDSLIARFVEPTMDAVIVASPEGPPRVVTRTIAAEIALQQVLSAR
jgi:CIC family chloride channel protein